MNISKKTRNSLYFKFYTWLCVITSHYKIWDFWEPLENGIMHIWWQSVKQFLCDNHFQKSSCLVPTKIMYLCIMVPRLSALLPSSVVARLFHQTHGQRLRATVFLQNWQLLKTSRGILIKKLPNELKHW